MPEPENVRSSQRFDVSVDIDWTHASTTRSSTTKNLSLGGAYIASSERLPSGTEIQVRFVVPTQKEPVEVGAVIRWQDGLGFGVQFAGPRARDVWALNKFLDDRA